MGETKYWVILTILVLGLLAAVTLYGGLGSAAAAEKFPSREIIMVVQFAPGGNTDVNARFLAPYLRNPTPHRMESLRSPLTLTLHIAS
jgi:tripartite-type tricarboxylate transporter receptor subunit TctC